MYDHVVVGAGSVGAIIAAHVSEIPNKSVALNAYRRIAGLSDEVAG
jgi:choline dehydrogenase-like flavoprotein